MSSQITTTCFHESGIFNNGHIFSFRNKNGDHDSNIYKVKNKDFTLYGEYYRGEKWKNNFREIFNDKDFEIYSVTDNKGRNFKLGDYAKDLDGKTIMITEFEVDSDKEIFFRGVRIVNSLGILGKNI